MKLSRLILLVILIKAAPYCYAQPFYFNERYDVNGRADGSGSIIEVQNGYLDFIFTDDFTDYGNKIGLLKLNKQGVTNFVKIWKNDTVQFVTSARIKLAADSSILLCGQALDTITNLNYGFIFKLDKLLDSIWCKFYRFDETGSQTLFDGFQNILPFEDGSMVLMGTEYKGTPNGTDHDMILYRLDLNGEIIWKKKYPSFYSESPFSIGFDPLDSSLYVMGEKGKYSTAPINDRVDNLFYKIDKNGDVITTKTFNGGNNEVNAYAILNQNGEYDFMYLGFDTTWNNNYVYYSPAFGRLDENGDTLFTRRLTNEKYWSGIWGFKQVASGGYVGLVSSVRDSSFVSIITGNLYRVNQDGELLWERKYWHKNNRYAQNYVSDIITTSDGGFAICGYISYPLDTGTQDAWVIKLDSVGCPYPNCPPPGTGVVDISSLIDGSNLWLYPNPTSEMFSVYYLGENKETELILSNSFGQQVKREVFFGNTITIQTSDLPKGVYLVSILEEGILKTTKKLVLD